MYNKVNLSDAEYLRSVLGTDAVLYGEQINPDYAHDELGGVSKMPELVARVSTTEEISAVMKHAYNREIPVTVRGSGTGLVGGAVAVEGGIILETTKMNRILELDKDTLTVRVQPGVLLMELAAFAEKHFPDQYSELGNYTDRENNLKLNELLKLSPRRRKKDNA